MYVVNSKQMCKRPQSVNILFLLLAMILAGCREDRREVFYNNLTDAEKAGAVERRWIPTFLPDTARNIHEMGDLSPAKVWCAFEFLPVSSEQFRMSLKPVEDLPPSVRRIPQLGKAWWPSILEGDIDRARVQGAGFQLYIAEEPETASTKFLYLFAIDWGKGRGYFYVSSS